MSTSSSFRGRVVRTLKSILKPEWLFRQKRKQQIAAHYARLSNRQSSSILGDLITSFKQAARRSRFLPRRLQLESLEMRKLLSATAYVSAQANWTDTTSPGVFAAGDTMLRQHWPTAHGSHDRYVGDPWRL